MEKIGKYEVHDLASRLPLMSNEEFDALKESIRTQGLMHPIIVSDFNPLLIIDGRNRLRACLELGAEPKFIVLTEFLDESRLRRELTRSTDITEGLNYSEEQGDINLMIEHFIIMQNVLRRQLTDWQKYKQITAVKGKPKKGGDGSNQHKKKSKSANVAPLLSATPTTKEIAEDLGVSERTTKRMNVIDDKATEEVKEKLAEDKISVNAAYEETVKQTKKTDPKPKKPDWFEENIEDDNERFIMREIVKLTKKIENECGILYMLTLRELINKYDHLNYKTSWK